MGGIIIRLYIIVKIFVKRLLFFWICMENTMSTRLREERERLGVSQEAMAKIGGVTKLSVFNYENNREPSSSFLAKVSGAGIDIQYVLLGVRSELTRGERATLDHYRQTNEEGQKIIEQTAFFAAQSTKKIAGKERA